MSLPLERYGAIGDMTSLALVGDHGGIDWLCWPRFDSPSLFGRLLDPDGGHWTIAPTGEVTARKQMYLSSTNVLLTRLHLDGAVLELEDAMAVHDGPRLVLRRVRCVRGRADVTVELAPAPDYGRRAVELRRTDGGIEVGIGDDRCLHLSTSVDVDVSAGTVTAQVTLDEGESVWFALGESIVDDPAPAFDATIAHWRSWSAQGTYRGRWRPEVERSALALKLLTHADSGGLIAAGTTSLPEVVGGGRNWDYRYVWIRDAAFVLYALLEIGHEAEAQAFTSWLSERIESCDPAGDDPPLSPLYDLDGNDDLDETTLDHWAGYRGSRPVRVGNAASGQLQLDIYGELIDSVYIADRRGEGVSLATWDHVCMLVDWVIDHWQRPDDGMWEARSGPRRYTSSLLMCWVAVERAMRMARRRGRPAPLDAWREARDAMHRTLRERGFDEHVGAYTQVLDGDALDASVLLMPLVKFVPPDDPTWLRTLDAVGERLAHGPLVDRYDLARSDDGLEGEEGSFTICSFWYVEALARAGRVVEARDHYERLLTYATPTGLFSEEIGDDGRLLGNFPQGFTHLSLISAAVALDEALDR